MNSRDLIRLAPQTLIQSALRQDAVVLSTQPDVYIRENAVNYDLAINTWLLAIRDYAPYTWPSIATRIQRLGLQSTVKLFTHAAGVFLVTGSEPDETLPRSLYREIVRTFSVRTLSTVHYESSFTPEGIFLFLCRYLKRFTPLNADKLENEAISSFLSNQNRLKMVQRNGYNQLIMDLIRSEVDGDIINSRTRRYATIKMYEAELTPGVCYTLSGKSCKTNYEKLMSLRREYHFDTLPVLRDSVWHYDLGHTARLMTVPKSFTSARTIAPEEVLRQAVAHRMFSLRGNTPEGINLQDQSVNQEFAKRGSEDGTYCTIDLSHASDDVTWTLVQEIYANYPLYLRYLATIRPIDIVVNNRTYTLQSFATMGNSMTFLVESEVFWLITRAAVHFAQRHGVECSDTVICYGDDIICDSRAYEFVVSFLSKCGFSINLSKSYATGSFRESCGKDYLNGVDVSSPYFPRRPLSTLLAWYRDKNSEVITVAESLIMLQHRLIEVSPSSAQYIELYLKEAKDLGIMPVGTESTDLWGYDEVYAKTRYIPSYERITTSLPPKWVLKDGKWKYISKRYTYTKVVIEDDLHKRHFQLRPCVTVKTELLPDSLLYAMYLYDGPWYATDLDRQLGISTSRKLLPIGEVTSSWQYFEC